MYSHLGSLGMLLGRICLSLIFILAGISKFMDWDGTAQFMASKGMTFVSVFLVVAALIEIICGLSVLLGIRARLGALILLLYLIPATYLFHDFWNLEGPAAGMMRIEFLKNLAIFGGLLYVWSVGAGRWSIDACYGCNTSCSK